VNLTFSSTRFSINIARMLRIRILVKAIFLAFNISIQACSSNPDRLPIFGRYEVNAREIEGEIVNDTIYHTIQHFQFVNQERKIITNETFQEKVYVADFFFTSCPSICPVMKTQMLRVYDFFQDNQDVLFLSHTIDPAYDSVEVLYEYAKRLEVDSDRWHFVTGDKKDIYEIAQVSYMAVVAEDSQAPGGFIHSGKFLLVDKEARIRGAYDGIDEVDVDKLIADIEVLLKEYEN